MRSRQAQATGAGANRLPVRPRMGISPRHRTFGSCTARILRIIIEAAVCAPPLSDSRHHRLSFTWLASRQHPALSCDRGKRRSQASGHTTYWVTSAGGTPRASSLWVLRSQRSEPRRPQRVGATTRRSALPLTFTWGSTRVPLACPRQWAPLTVLLAARRLLLYMGRTDHDYTYTISIVPPGPALPVTRALAPSAGRATVQRSFAPSFAGGAHL